MKALDGWMLLVFLVEEPRPNACQAEKVFQSIFLSNVVQSSITPPFPYCSDLNIRLLWCIQHALNLHNGKIYLYFPSLICVVSALFKDNICSWLNINIITGLLNIKCNFMLLLGTCTLVKFASPELDDIQEQIYIRVDLYFKWNVSQWWRMKTLGHKFLQ